jgi:hypothetical protein
MLQSLAMGRSSAFCFYRIHKSRQGIVDVSQKQVASSIHIGAKNPDCLARFHGWSIPDQATKFCHYYLVKVSSYLALNYSAEDETGDMVSNEDTCTKKSTTGVFTEHMAELELDDSVDISIDMDKMGKKNQDTSTCVLW